MSAPLEALDVAVAPDLAAARLALHWAAQLPSAAGATLADKADDFSQTALEWRDAEGLLTGVALPDGRRAALRVRDLHLVVLGASGATTAELALAEETLDAGLDWLGKQLGGELSRPNHELPAHRVGEGGVFPVLDAAHLEELARYFAHAARALGALARGDQRASTVRCWPHHFDIATLITLDPDEDAEEARSVGVGMTPGDGGVAVPYFYVTPWPYPELGPAPSLEGGGRWTTDGWVGALLSADQLGRVGAQAQAMQIDAFLASAVDACMALLSRPS